MVCVAIVLFITLTFCVVVVVCKPCSLERYRSKEEKLQLLDLAIKSNDGNTIIIVSKFTYYNIQCSCHEHI